MSRLLILITDGPPVPWKTQNPCETKNILDDEEISVVIIGVGDGLDFNKVDCLVDSNDSILRASDFSDLGSISLDPFLCPFVQKCGDGVLNLGDGLPGEEECDDGNFQNNDGCSSGCLIEFCGDRIVQNLPSPELICTGIEYEIVNNQNIKRYRLEVINSSSFPDELFDAAPDLEPCGLNNNSSRTWVDVFDKDDNHLKGFCDLNSSEDLKSIWFSLLQGAAPPESVYITINDRECGIEYISNLAINCQDIPTIVELISFTASDARIGVALRWETATEIDTAGFNIWRANDKNGDYISVNGNLIPAKGSGAIGADYSYLDKNVLPGQTYYYKLEDVEIDGTRALHGPVSVIVKEINR